MPPQRRGLNAMQLGKLCAATKGCKAFTTDGWLKGSVQPKAFWASTQAGSCEGLYVKSGAKLEGKGGVLSALF